MAFENDFLDMMPHTVTHSTYASLDAYGKQSYSTANTSYSALIQYEQKKITGLDGNEVISTVHAILACTGSIDPSDRLTLPDGTSPKILTVGQVSDSGGQHHVEVYFGAQKVFR
jgi:hypothetical protein